MVKIKCEPFQRAENFGQFINVMLNKNHLKIMHELLKKKKTNAIVIKERLYKPVIKMSKSGIPCNKWIELISSIGKIKNKELDFDNSISYW